jgi:hypothetical protein
MSHYISHSTEEPVQHTANVIGLNAWWRYARSVAYLTRVDTDRTKKEVPYDQNC